LLPLSAPACPPHLPWRANSPETGVWRRRKRTRQHEANGAPPRRQPRIFSGHTLLSLCLPPGPRLPLALAGAVCLRRTGRGSGSDGLSRAIRGGKGLRSGCPI
jgi:hypothetical protein